MDRKIHELLSICLFIQEHGFGDVGYPYVNFGTCNYWQYVEILIIDEGFNRRDKGYDGIYRFGLKNFNEETYEQCKEHLARLRDKVVKM